LAEERACIHEQDPVDLLVKIPGTMDYSKRECVGMENLSEMSNV